MEPLSGISPLMRAIVNYVTLYACVCETVHTQKIMKEYNRLVHKICANEVAGQMYQDGALEQIELNEIQQSHNDIKSAEFLLNILQIRPPNVYWSFLRALEKTDQLDAYILLTDDGLNKSILPFLLLQCESKKSPLGNLTFFHFFHKRLRICNRFFTHLLNVHIFARLQIFIQLSPILTKLCHIKRDY